MTAAADTEPATADEVQTVMAARRLRAAASVFIGVGRPSTAAILARSVHPAQKVRLPGAGGAPEIATGCRDVVIIAPHTPRTFVEKLDLLTTTGGRATHVITDLGVLEPRDGELTLTQVHAGATPERVREATGWKLRVAGELHVTEPPSPEELTALRELLSR